MLSEINQFVNWVRRRNPNARTWKDYHYDLRQFAAQVGDVAPAAVTFREIDRFVDTQKSRGFQPTTINRRLATIISLYTFLADEDPTLVCPVLPHRHHLREPQRLPRPVQEDHLRAFFTAIEMTPTAKGEPDNRLRDRAMFILMLRCGEQETKSPQENNRCAICASHPCGPSTRRSDCTHRSTGRASCLWGTPMGTGTEGCIADQHPTLLGRTGRRSYWSGLRINGRPTTRWATD